MDIPQYKIFKVILEFIIIKKETKKKLSKIIK